jgi:flagellar hook protein FlgE
VVNQTQPGFGVATAGVLAQFNQGSLQSTGGAFDAAIQGDGFFVLKDTSGAQLLTRDGTFKADASGNLITSAGQYVQGWTQTNADGTVNTNGAIGNIQIPTGSLRAPVATKSFEFNLNLNSGANADSTSTFSAPVQAVDSLGNKQTLTASFTKTGANTWSYSVSIPTSALSPSSGSTNPLTTGTLTFDSSGNLTSPTAAPPSVLNQVAVSVTGLADGASDLSLNWNLSDPITGASQITQVAEPSAVSTSTQDGVAAAQLVKVGIGSGGSLVAQYSDGEQRNVGQIALATVRNPQSLASIGQNNYQLTSSSAAPVVGTPGTGGRGTIVGGQLESSTVDIATEFTKLIVFQRSYQANAKVVTTEDQLTQDTIAIKQ